MKPTLTSACGALGAVLVVVGAMGCQVTVTPPPGEAAIPAAASTPNPSANQVSATTASAGRTAVTPVQWSTTLEEMQSKFRMDSIPDPALPAHAETSVSPDGAWVAVTFTDEDGHSVLVVRWEDGGYSGVSSPSFLPWRPFSNMEWLSEEVLSFEVWSQPHYGWRYTVNVASGRLLDAEPIHD